MSDPATKPTASLGDYVFAQSTSPWRYVLESIVMGTCGWVPTLIGIALRAVFYRMILSADGMFVIEDQVRLTRPRDIRLGKGTYVGAGARLSATPNGIVVGRNTRIMPGAVIDVYNYRGIEDAGIRIGDDCVVGPDCIIYGARTVTIGDHVLMGARVTIIPHDHPHERGALIRDQGMVSAPVTIEDNVWLGANAIVLKGVTIGTGSVIGAGSIVTRDVPPYTVVAGSPARVIRSIE
jgi:acetyltransferase-like isoleucine patch superfamily enzyme